MVAGAGWGWGGDWGGAKPRVTSDVFGCRRGEKSLTNRESTVIQCYGLAFVAEPLSESTPSFLDRQGGWGGY